jgi:uncharacterized DUF497 family protein
MGVNLSYNQAKNESNILLRGLDFNLVKDFNWFLATIYEDTRKNYGENRFVAIGSIDESIYVVIFTPRGNKIHVISLRKANKREVKKYEEKN